MEPTDMNINRILLVLPFTWSLNALYLEILTLQQGDTGLNTKEILAYLLLINVYPLFVNKSSWYPKSVIDRHKPFKNRNLGMCPLCSYP